MKKSELVNKISEDADITKAQADQALDILVECITSTLKAGDKVAIPGLGSFSTSERKARTGRNPQTGAEIKIAASTAAKFSVAKALKDALN